MFLLLLMSALTLAQAPAPADVESTLKQAHAEIASFEKAGGKLDDPNHPVEKWVEALWAFRKPSTDERAVARATSEGIHLLVHADRFDEVYARTAQVAATETAWEILPQVLKEAGTRQKDFTRFFAAMEAELAAKPSRKTRAAVELNLARAWTEKKEPEKAKAAFQEAMMAAPASLAAKMAESGLYELLKLGPGQPAPQFSVAALDGARVSLAAWRGKPVALVFWATH